MLTGLQQPHIKKFKKTYLGVTPLEVIYWGMNEIAQTKGKCV